MADPAPTAPPAPPAPLAPGSTIGILGGGQLGRMLAMAAARLGLRAAIYDPAEAPAAAEVARHHRGGFDDLAALAAFAGTVDVVTFEFENVPASAAAALAAEAPVHPPERALAAAQDRAEEKRFLAGLGIATAPWAEVGTAEDLAGAVARIGTPAILKTRRFGYDGKGQARLQAPEDAAAAWAAVGGAPSVLEGFVAFDAEISVIAARGQDGQVAAFDPGMNRHEDGILRRTTVPAPVSRAAAQEAVLTAGRILNALDYVGVIGVEFFVAGRQLMVNEFAPRVHNSGHWTEAACLIDQFEQHIRAVAGWPLGDGSRHSDAVMDNLIGADLEAWQARSAEPARLHIYGKGEIRPGRKMGHITRISPKS